MYARTPSQRRAARDGSLVRPTPLSGRPGSQLGGREPAFAFIAPLGLSKTHWLAHMLDSLVRVSRRVGWVTDLLAASFRPPTGPPSRSAPAVRSPTPGEVRRSGGRRLRRSVPRVRYRGGGAGTSAGRRATGGAARHRRRALGAPPATCRPPPSMPSRFRCPTGCGVLRAGDKCVRRNGTARPDGPASGNRIRRARSAPPD